MFHRAWIRMGTRRLPGVRGRIRVRVRVRDRFRHEDGYKQVA